nr:FGGY-family carbohydrate kinase [uncultured Cohaesibacter sp.]
MGEYLLGLDAGNTVVKAVLFDLEGQQVAIGAKEGGTIYPQCGHVERDLNNLWEVTACVIRDCLAKANVDPSEILAVGCSGHGNGLYLLDKEGEPLVGIQSMDSRATELVEKANSDGTADKLYPICLQRPWPSQTPSILAWIKANRPDLYARTGTAFLCKDYVTYRLTGHIGSDYSDMSGCALLSMEKRGYDAELMALYGLDDAMDMLPPLSEPFDIVGTISAQTAEKTDLAVGTPVVAGVFDVVASAIGSGAVNVGDASIVAGTWSINQVIIDKPVLDGEIFMTSSFGNGLYMKLEASATSAGNLEWFVKDFIENCVPESQSPYDLCNQLVASVELSANLPLYHPFLFGNSANGAARAGFYGIGGWHGRADMLFALYEGVVFGHRHHIESLRAAGGCFDKAILSGGASHSEIWPQMFADILDVPITIAPCQETGALGAAIVAGIGTGRFKNYGEGAVTMTRTERHYQPNRANQTIYNKRYMLFEDLSGLMARPWETLKTLSV